MQVIAVGSPKGGVGKTTTSVTVATILARQGMGVLLVDCDTNRSAIDWCGEGSEHIPVDVADGSDPVVLRRLRDVSGYDVAVVDLPGARAGAFQTILAGDNGKPVADVMLVPTSPELMDLRPVIRVVRGEVLPLGLACLLVFTRVDPVAMTRARHRRRELCDEYRLGVAEAIIRDYVVYREALERSRTVLDIGGPQSYARRAELDYRALSDEVLRMMRTVQRGS